MYKRLIIILLSFIFFNMYCAGEIDKWQTIKIEIKLTKTKKLLNAIRSADTHLVLLLLENTFDINFAYLYLEELRLVLPENNAGFRPLHLACTLGNKEIVSLLLAKGADANLRISIGSSERNALMCAILANKIEIVKLLLNYGANVKFINSHGVTSLHYAIHANNKDLVELLLSKGGDSRDVQDMVNATGRFFETPLLRAISCCSKDVIYLLIDAGAQKNINGVNLNRETISKIAYLGNTAYIQLGVRFEQMKLVRLEIIEMIENYVSIKTR